MPLPPASPYSVLVHFCASPSCLTKLKKIEKIMNFKMSLNLSMRQLLYGINKIFC